MVFQRPVLLRRIALANLASRSRSPACRRASAIGARARRSSASGSRDRAPPARVLSGGEQQRLALARAWALEPEVLFLDEPTANLDPGSTREIERMIGAIHAAGTTIVMTTHNLGQARRLADEILFIHGGRLAERTRADRFLPRTRDAPRPPHSSKENCHGRTSVAA